MTDAGDIAPKAGADTDEPTFDPRHDAVFQRGYDPAASAPSAAPPARAARRVSPPPPSRDLSTLQGDVNVLKSRLGEVSGRDSGSVEEQATDAAGQAPLTPLVPDASASETGRNPFIVALWFIGVAFVAGGVILQWQASVSGYNSSFSADEIPVEVIIQQLVWTITPTMISVGAMTLVALVFWHAVTWRAASPVAADPTADPTAAGWPEPNQDA